MDEAREIEEKGVGARNLKRSQKFEARERACDEKNEDR